MPTYARSLSQIAYATVALSLCFGAAVSHAAGAGAGHAHVQTSGTSWVQVEDAWVRAMVQGQTGTGGFMTLKAKQALTLEGFQLTGPGVAELHEMRMDGTVMRMRAIPSLALPAGTAVALKPGGHHLMLTQLPGALKQGDVVALTLKLRTADGQAVTQALRIPVEARQPNRALPQAGHGGAAPHPHHPGHAH